MEAGLVCRGQGVFFQGRWGTIQRRSEEDCVVVKFRDGERVVSISDLFPATQSRECECGAEVEEEVEEEVVGEVEDPVTLEIETTVFDRASELGEDDEEKPEEEVEAEMAEEFE